MAYTIKEIFYTLQGEGERSGRAAVFCRFSGCNLWSGREEDRASAVCKFCDTDFRGGEKFESAQDLAGIIDKTWPKDRGRYVVFTGGEPLLQLDDALIRAVHGKGFEVAVETNGTISASRDIDWICVSPKAGTNLVQRSGDELKLVFPQPDAMPESLQSLSFRHFFLQPMDGPSRKENTEAAVKYCLEHPQWRVSIQTHKLLNLR